MFRMTKIHAKVSKGITMTKAWTKQAAIKRLKSNKLLQEALRIEPRLNDVIEAAQQQENVEGYHRIRRWYELKHWMNHLVGFQAEKEQIRTMKHWDAVRDAVNDLLPPDDVDLHPDGKPDDEE
jgi:hypothetical protein